MRKLLTSFFLALFAFMFSRPATAVVTGTATAPAPAVQQTSAPATEASSPSFLDILAFSPDGFNWRVDWWKALIVLLSLTLILTMLVRLGGKLLRFIAWASSLAFATAVSYFFQPLLTPWLENNAPWLQQTPVPIHIWSHIICFIPALLLATLLVILLRKPYDVSAGKKGKHE